MGAADTDGPLEAPEAYWGPAVRRGQDQGCLRLAQPR